MTVWVSVQSKTLFSNWEYLNFTFCFRADCSCAYKRLLREGNDVALLSNQKENYEMLKLILIRLECMCILPGPPKRFT
jgi:hypothetical protein